MEDDLDLAGGLYQPHEMSEIERLADGFRTGQTDGTAISLSQTSETWGLPSPRAQGGAAALSQGGAVRPEPLLRINAPRPRLSSLEDEDGSHEGEDLDLLRGLVQPPDPSRKQIRKICWTWYKNEANVLPKANDIKKILANISQYAFQLELCPSTGRVHWQGWAYNYGAKEWRRWKAMLSGAHIEEQLARFDTKAAGYCLKEDTRHPVTAEYPADEIGPHFKGFTPPAAKEKVIDPLEGKQLRPFQKSLLEMYTLPGDDRKITVVVDDEGNSGKTALAKSLALRGEAMIVSGNSKDLLSAVAFWVNGDKDTKTEGKPLKLVIWNVARARQDKLAWGAVEELKDGAFFSGKYKGTQVLMNPPHVWVFMNLMPDMKMLSKDRWNIFKVDKDFQLVKIEPAWPMFDPATRQLGREELTYAAGGLGLAPRSDTAAIQPAAFEDDF